MQVTVIDGCKYYDEYATEVVDYIASHLADSGTDFKLVSVDKLDIKPCTGCFKCWTHTPGRCVIKDDMDQVMQAIVDCDYLIYLGDISFGGYNSELKIALDRSIGLALPFFQKVGNETHHPLRYEPKQTVFCVGLLSENNEESSDIFIRYTKRLIMELSPNNSFTVIMHRNSPAEFEAQRLTDLLLEEL
jgi:multimeric flavodoxin WrbA